MGARCTAFLAGRRLIALRAGNPRRSRSSLGKRFDFLSLNAATATGPTTLQVSVTSFAQDPSIGLHLSATRSYPDGSVLVSEQHASDDVLTTANSTLSIGDSLSGVLTYHGPAGRVSLRFRPLAVQTTPAHQIHATMGVCGQQGASQPAAATRHSVGSLSVSGTLQVNACAVQRAVLDQNATGAVIAIRPADSVFDVTGVFPPDKAVAVPTDATMQFHLTKTPRVGDLLLELAAVGNLPAPLSNAAFVPLGTPHYDASTHLLTVRPRIALKPHTRYKLALVADDGTSRAASITYFTTGA